MKTKILTSIAAAMMLMFTSCNDYLDVLPKGQLIPQTTEDFAGLLNNEYTVHYSPILNGLYLLNDYQVDKSYLSSDDLRRACYMWEESADRATLNKADEATYYQNYGAINYCNLIIENVPGSKDGSEARKAELVAYAKMIRAQAYYIMVNFYADQYVEATAANTPGIPVIYSADVDAPSTQESVAKVYELILADVNDALENGLPEKSENVLHPDRATAYAFLCRVYMSMGRYEDALAYADKALAANSQLFDWNEFYDLNAELIENPEDYSTLTTPISYTYVENYNFRSGDRSPNYASNDIDMPEARGELFEDGDAKFMCRWKLRTNGVNTYWQGIARGFHNYMGLTTVEMYLDKAECLARKGNLYGAMDLLDQVRVTRIRPDKYAPSSASTLADAIAKIRRTKDNELIFSIVPFADARRFNAEGTYARTLEKTVDGVTYTLRPQSHLWTMVFPAGAINNPGNGTLSQNSK